jgi:hypothetical protein
MKTTSQIIIILLLSLMTLKAGADSCKAISYCDTALVIINKPIVYNNSTCLVKNPVNEHIFAAVPDTTIDIIIIYRRIFASANENHSLNK